MQHNKRAMAVILGMLVAVLVAACGQAPVDTEEHDEPAVLEPIDGTDLNRVILTDRAAERLDIQTAEVAEESVNGSQRLVIPYSALIYDLTGGTWIYISPEPLTYIREQVAVDFIDGDKVILTEGPSVGTQVVTVAVAQLYGTDTGVGK